MEPSEMESGKGVSGLSSKKAIPIVVVAVLIAALVGGAVYFVLHVDSSNASGASAVVSESSTGKVSVKVNCDGWNPDTSTPIVVSVYSGDVKDTLTSTDENTVAPDPLFTKEVQAGVETDLDDIKDNGTYTIAVTGSPILDDGTIFDLPEPQVVDFDTAKGASVEITLTAKAADQVTEADIAAAQATAVASGADAEKVTAKASNATNKAATAQGGTVASGTANAATKSNANKTGTTIPSGNQGGNTSGGSTGSGEQAHQHSWTPITKTVHHEAQYKTVHHDPQYKTVHHDAVTKGIMVCKDCGKEGIDSSHLDWELDRGNNGSYYTKTVTVSNAYDERVLVSAAYDEQVLVSAAYDETVTTGYKCSGCGATKSN